MTTMEGGNAIGLSGSAKPALGVQSLPSKTKSAFSGTLFDWTPAFAGVTINTPLACYGVVYFSLILMNFLESPGSYVISSVVRW